MSLLIKSVSLLGVLTASVKSLSLICNIIMGVTSYSQSYSHLREEDYMWCIYKDMQLGGAF